MLVWIENAPFERNSEEEIVQVLDQYLTCSAGNKETAYLVNLQPHNIQELAEKKEKTVCRFGFPLPPLPKTMCYILLQRMLKRTKRNTKSFKK